MPLSERLTRNREWWNIAIAAALPQRVRYWATMIELGGATRNSKNVPATTLDEILQNLQK